MNEKNSREKTIPKEFKYVADILLSIIKRKNLDKDEIIATLICWSKETK